MLRTRTAGGGEPVRSDACPSLSLHSFTGHAQGAPPLGMGFICGTLD